MQKKYLISLILVIVCLLTFSIFYGKHIFKTANKWIYKDSIHAYSAEYKVDPFLIYAIVKEESSFYRYAYSRAGAMGLMQLMPGTASYLARELGIANFEETMLFDAEINLKLGCYYVSKLMKYFDNDLLYVLAAYNAGITNVLSWKKKNFLHGVHDIPFRETRGFVTRVLRNYKDSLESRKI